MDYPVNWYVLMDILSVLGALVHQHSGEETISISAGEDDRCELEWFSFTSLGPPYLLAYRYE